MQSTKKRISFDKILWCKIRYYQQLNDIPNEVLADIMGVKERTLHEYDKCASAVTLDKIGNFLEYTGLTKEELIS